MKIQKYLVIVVSALLLAACDSKPKNEKNDKPYIPGPSIVLEAKDTTDINILAEEYVSYFKNNDLDAVANLLYTLKNDSVHPYTDEQKANFKKGLSHFHIYDAKLKSLSIRSKFDNEFKISIQIMPDGSIAENRGVTTFSLNPIKLGDTWYLTVRDLRAEGIREEYANQ